MRFLTDRFNATLLALSLSFIILISISHYGNKVQGQANAPRSAFQRGALKVNDKLILVKDMVGSPLNYVQRVVYRASDEINNFVYLVFHFSEVEEENEKLKALNSILEDKLHLYDSAKTSNEELRTKLDFKDKSSYYEVVQCSIIAKGGGNAVDIYTIDKGAKDGLDKGMIVATNAGVFGQVLSVNKSWSVVAALGNNTVKIAASTADSIENSISLEEYTDLTKYRKTRSFLMPVSTDMKIGDVVITSDYRLLYPKGIRIGYVIGIEENYKKAEKSAIVQSFVDFSDIKEVFVIIPKDKANIIHPNEEMKDE